MKFSKKVALVILGMLPFSSAVSFAIESGRYAQEALAEKDLQKEFLLRLANGDLPEKYYVYFEQNNILSVDDLNDEKNADIKKKALAVFEKENENVLAGGNETISLR